MALRGSKGTLSHISESNGMSSDEVHSGRRLNEAPGIVTSGILGVLIFIGLICYISRKTLRPNIDKVAADYNEEHEAELAREAEIQRKWTEQQFAPSLAGRSETPGLWKSLKEAAQKHRLRKDERSRKKKLRERVHAEQQDSENGALETQTDWAYGVGLKNKSPVSNSSPSGEAAACADTGIWGSFKRSTRKMSARFHKERSKAGKARSKQQLSPQASTADVSQPGSQCRTSSTATPEAQTKASTADVRQPGSQSRISSTATPDKAVSDAGQTNADVGLWGSFKQASRSKVRKLTGRLADQAAKVRPKRKRAPKGDSNQLRASDPGPRQAACASPEDAAAESFQKKLSETSQPKSVWLPEKQSSKGKLGRATEGRRYSRESLASQSTHVSAESNLP